MRRIHVVGTSLVVLSIGTSIAACMKDDECLLFYDCPEKAAKRTCGEPGLPLCHTGEPCAYDSDCVGGECDQGACKANCKDGERNNIEVNIDCGPGCLPCDLGLSCVDEDGTADGAYCESGFCADGVCCNELCAGECVACVRKKTGRMDGACEPVSDTSTPCGQGPGCSGESLVTGYCDGAGNCGQVASCVPYTCVDTACKTQCASSSDCATGYCCNSSAECVSGSGIGERCSNKSECCSGFCVDGVCCSDACGAQCMSCNLEGSVGECVADPYGTDPDDDCISGALGAGVWVCNGSGECTEFKFQLPD